jgi:hypothetical protein
MASEQVQKFAPHRSISLGGFDRRGCAASISSASATGMTVSGVWSDAADFVTLNLFNADDNFGQNYSTRYLPDTDVTGLVVSFRLAITNGFYPGSSKFQSVPWGKLSWIKPDGSGGTSTIPLFADSAFSSPNPTGTRASRNITIGGTPAAGDRFQIIYAGNYVADYTAAAGGSGAPSLIAAQLAAQINALNAKLGTAVFPLTATAGSGIVQITCQQPGTDGNTIELWTQFTTTASATMAPLGATKLAGGADPSFFYARIDLGAMGITSLLKCWLTLAPPLPIDTAANNQTLNTFTPGEFSYVFSSWTVTSRLQNLNLRIAGPGSVIVGSMDGGAKFYGGWSLTPGAYYRGFGRQSSNPSDRVAITYNCQSSHNLYVATLTGAGQGTLNVTVDGVTSTTIDCSVGSGSARRLVATALAPGKHTVAVSVLSGACVFDCIQAAVLSDVNAPTVTYSTLNAACDYDTLAGLIPPARLLWQLQKRGWTGDLDFYAGVLLGQHKRVRYGGYFPGVTITLAGTIAFGTGQGDGSQVFVSLGTGKGTTTIGAAAFPADNLTSLAQRLVNGINATFVGVQAYPTGTAGQFIVKVLTPINGFPISVKTGTTTGVTITMVGDSNGMIGPGNEGTWAIDPTQTSPLTRAFKDYMADLCTIVHAAGQSMTVAFSQELLGPPDVNTNAGAWVQRYANNRAVQTATGFGAWGVGTVQAISGPNITQYGHGYLDSYQVNFTNPTTGETGSWTVLQLNSDTYLLDEPVNGTTYTPQVGDAASASLVTAQCCFSSTTVTPYMSNCYVQMANLMAAGGLVPWLQFGEILHWFFSYAHGVPIISFYNYGGNVAVATKLPVNVGTAGSVPIILAGTGFMDGTQYATVIDNYNLVTSVAWPGTAPNPQGTVTGGGMGLYDANQQTAYGGAIPLFFTQDDSISGVGSTVTFLQQRIDTHVRAIRTAVLAAQSGAKFEILYPTDVTAAACYYTNDFPYPQGGVLNNAINLPASWHTKSGSPFDRWKTEALSWQSFYFNFANFIAMVAYPIGLGWAMADTAILIGWNYGGAPWTMAYLYALNQSVPALNFWAVDHDSQFSWPALLPGNQPTTQTE